MKVEELDVVRAVHIVLSCHLISYPQISYVNNLPDGLLQVQVAPGDLQFSGPVAKHNAVQSSKALTFMTILVCVLMTALLVLYLDVFAIFPTMCLTFDKIYELGCDLWPNVIFALIHVEL